MADRQDVLDRAPWSTLLALLQGHRRRSGSSDAPINVIQIPPPHAHRRRSGHRHFRSWAGACWSPLASRARSSSSSSQSPQSQPLHPHAQNRYLHHHFQQHLLPISHHHHHHQLRLQLQQKPRNNLLAALASLMVITIMCTAVVQPRWFSFSSGICSRRYIGLQEFMYLRPITSSSSSSPIASPSIAFPAHSLSSSTDQQTPNMIPVAFAYGQSDSNSAVESHMAPAARVLEAGGVLATAHLTGSSTNNLNDSPLTGAIITQPPLPPAPHQWKQTPNLLRMMADHYEMQLNACIPAQVLSLQRTIITLCFAVMLLNLAQLMLDSMSIRNKHLDLLRRMAVFNIAGVIICVLIIALSYLISNILADDQLQRQLQRDRYVGIEDPRASVGHEPQRVEINFELSYYLISLAGLLGLVAAALNLFSRPPSPFGYETSRLNEPEAGALLPDPHLSTPLWAPLPQLDTSTPLPNAFFNPPPPPYSA